jgi:lytic murein transglycosylase
VFLGLTALPTIAPAAVNRTAVEIQFRNWLAGPLTREARTRNISGAAIGRILGRMKLDWSLPDLRPPGAARPPRQQHQSEFRSPARYFGQNNLDALVALGRARLKKWRKTLDAIEKRYGVPRRIIMAIWGRESGYGRVKMPKHALRTLATRAFMGARKAFFRKELLAAVQIAAREHVPPAHMKSSWAGALGQPQFMPSKYLQFAVDFDGDGRRDIWNSVPDTLASIAHFLRRHGWQPGRDWGFESLVPASVSCTLEGPEQGKSIRDWIRMGVSRVRGRLFPASEHKKTGYLLMPAGRMGPAFIATANFHVLKSYNESDLYALFIGHLADRYGRNRPFVTPWTAKAGFTRRAVQRMQDKLVRLGYDVGGADGLVGFKTRIATGQWQRRHKLTPSCFPDRSLVKRFQSR